MWHHCRKLPLKSHQIENATVERSHTLALFSDQKSSGEIAVVKYKKWVGISQIQYLQRGNRAHPLTEKSSFAAFSETTPGFTSAEVSELNSGNYKSVFEALAGLLQDIQENKVFPVKRSVSRRATFRVSNLWLNQNQIMTIVASLVLSLCK